MTPGGQMGVNAASTRYWKSPEACAQQCLNMLDCKAFTIDWRDTPTDGQEGWCRYLAAGYSTAPTTYRVSAYLKN